jgi:signal transduction histidine kinase
VEPDPLAVVSHELRNLIATFIGFSELLLNNDWPLEKQREYLETMRDEGVRVSGFLNELLDLQKLEAGAVQLETRPTDMASLLESAANLAAHDTRHPVSLAIEGELPLADAEPNRIQQVLANLLSNARKYSPRGGPITLGSRAVACHIEVFVEDRGVGIPPELIDRVFDKFFRVESLLHRQVRGIGLGLSICKQIIEAHHGRIWAESDGLGHGTRVCFSLPVAGTPARGEAQLSSRSEYVSSHQRDGRYARGVSRSAAVESPWRTRAVLSPGYRSSAHG